jgi:hypothetical protein
MNDVFVSYSRKDRDTVKKLVEVMKSQGWSVWWDPTIRPGEYYEDVIEHALTDAKCVVVVWSKNFVASKWVRAEAAEAANRGVLVPVVIDDAKIPFRFKQIQEAHLSDWKFTPDHPGLVSLLESIAEKFIKAQDAQDNQTANEFQSAQVTDEEDDEFAESPVDENVAPVDIASSIERETFENENARPSRHPVIRQPGADERPTVGKLHTPLASKRNLVIPALIIIGVITVGGVIYRFASRETTSTGNGNQSGTVNRASNPQSNTGNAALAPATPTPAISASPSPVSTERPVVSAIDARRIASLLRGKWQSQNATSSECECDTNACLDIQFNKTIPDFCIQANQIYVNARFQLDAANKKAYLFFDAPGSDLGVGGSRLPWKAFDNNKPLATLDLSDLEAQHLIYVTWHGFTEMGDTTRKWRQLGSGFQGTYMKR